MPFSKRNKAKLYNTIAENAIKTLPSASNLTSTSSINEIKANLWPYPKEITQGENYYDFSYSSLVNNNIFNNYKQYISLDLDHPLKDFDTYLTSLLSNKASTSINKLIIKNVSITYPEIAIDNLTLQNHQQYETYQLSISDKGEVTIKASTYMAMAYALTTLQQLITVTDTNNLRISNLPININDSPNTYYRGNFLDVARTFFPVADILAFIKFNAYAKLNFINLHLMDNQSFPIALGNITTILASVKSSDRSTIDYQSGPI